MSPVSVRMWDGVSLALVQMLSVCADLAPMRPWAGASCVPVQMCKG